jgi:16S rRNA (guanine527-N7)-methyltransferase
VPRPSPLTVEVPLIAEVASRVGLNVGSEALAGLAAFAELFLTWNERINLGGAISERELIARHFIDGFAAARFVETDSVVVDVGSGGGLPAIPLALVRTDVTLRLFEPTGKKVSFLRTAVRELGLKDRVAVHAQRVVADSVGAAGGADVAMSRATLAPADWLLLARSLIRPGGTVLVFGTGGAGDPAEPPRSEWRYGTARRLLAYGRVPGDRST